MKGARPATATQIRDAANKLLEAMARQHGNSPFSLNVTQARLVLTSVLARGRVTRRSAADKADRLDG